VVAWTYFDAYVSRSGSPHNVCIPLVWGYVWALWKGTQRFGLCRYPPTVAMQKLTLAVELRVFLSSCWLSQFTLIIVGSISALTIFNMKLLLWFYVLYAGAARILRDSEGMQCVLNGDSNCPFVMIFRVQFLALTSTPSLNTQQSSHFEHAPLGCFGLSAYLCPQSH